MNPRTQRCSIAGPAGAIACAIDTPEGDPRGVAVICHPHPQHGGTMDNKVAQTLARSLLQLGYRAVRFNFRGVGASEGAWDEGRGELDDALAVTRAQAAHGLPLVLAGFSFGGFIAASAAAALADERPVERLILVGPSTERHVLPAVPADTLVVHGELDEVVPLAATLAWARPQSLPVVVIPGGGHFFHGQLALLKNIVLRAWH